LHLFHGEQLEAEEQLVVGELFASEKSPQDPRHARIPRPRYGAPSVKFTYAWADVLSLITLDCITETIEFTFLWFSLYK